MASVETIRAARAAIYGGHFMAATGHAAASLAAARIYERGGSLMDAAIAASAASAVVLGHAAGIGGDCFLLYHDGATGKTHGLNASGTAPALASPARFPDGMAAHGAAAAVVPGLVSAWDWAHRRFGRLPWGALLQPAIALAEAHPVSKVAAERAGAQADELASDAGCAALYLPGGKPVATGDMLRQPALAATLRAIAQRGADVFYRGDLARGIAQFLGAKGGLMRASDLAGYEPVWMDPIATVYRDHRVLVMPPNSCGALLLMQLDGLSALQSSALAGAAPARMAWQMSAMQAAFAAGVASIADARAVPDAARILLAPEMKARMRDAVLALGHAGPVRDSGGTSALVLADAEGNGVSLVQSIFNVFGARLLDPATGILFNNRMQGFAHRPDMPNSVGPGKRPAHTLCPVIVLKEGRLRFAMGTPGGLSQTLTNAQILCALLDRGFDVQSAVEAPRWCNTKAGDFLIEREFPEPVLAALAKLGHKARRRDDGYFYGSAKIAALLPSGVLAGAADFRREGYALGF
jgi:gamma-glutamyltranspeptidase/glutathione hydrolase